MPYAEAIGLVNLILLLVLCLRALSTEVRSRYPVFFGYLCFQLLLTLCVDMTILLAGTQSVSFRYLYYLGYIATPVFQSWVLWDLLKKLTGDLEGRSKLAGGVVFLTLLMGAPVLWTMWFLPARALYRYEAAALALQMLLCLLIYLYLLERRDIEPGRNVRGILLGTALMVGFQCLNFVTLLAGQTSFELFRFLVPSIYLSALMVFAYSVWEYEPIERMPRRREVDLQLQRGIRSVLQLLLPR